MFYRVLPISQKRRNSTWDEARTVVVQPRHRCECERSPERRPSLGFELGEFLGKMVLQLGDGSKPWYLVNPKIAGKWMFIPLKMVLIGIDPYPNLNGSRSANCRDHIAMFPGYPAINTPPICTLLSQQTAKPGLVQRPRDWGSNQQEIETSGDLSHLTTGKHTKSY